MKKEQVPSRVATFERPSSPTSNSVKAKKSRWKYAPLLLMSLFLLVTHVGKAQKQMEKLGRGVVAVRSSSSQVFVSWRLFGTDPSGIAFNVYRGSTKINASPITNATNYVDNTTANGSYTVRPVLNGTEQAASAAASVWAQQYLSIPLQRPANGTTPTGESYSYNANDCSVGDLDGDGEYEIVLKWDPSNSKDNSQSGYTGNVYIDGYKLNGTRLWRIDLGRNIRAGAHYTQLMVYDLDGDGKAEIACKTAENTRDGANQYLSKGPAANDNNNADYRTSGGYILSGPEYLTIFNGQTGAELATTNYEPARGTVSSWGDGYGNRVDRFVAGVAYLDGQRPSLVMGRGYYTRLVRVAYDWRNGQLTRRWIFDSNTSGNGSYAGQGNHQVTVGDVDGDGKDEFINGSSAINDNGTGLWANALGHGDAMHMSDMNPDRAGQEIWQCYEGPAYNGGTGLALIDARTGGKIWTVPVSSGDIGRALAADIDSRYKGYEMWGATGGLYTCTGTQIGTTKPSVNFAVWWDGDLQRELLNGTTIDKWNPSTNSLTRQLTAYNFGAADNNSTKATPNLSADLLGDWREEVIWRSSDNTQLLLFTTTIPTTNRLYTLMHDPQYRLAIAWQNTAYNQPPHPSFYLGGGMAAAPSPNITLVGATTTPPTGSSLANGTYTITARHSGQLLDVAENSTADGANVTQYTAQGSNNQKWLLTSTGDGYYTIKAVHSGKSLDVNGASTADGANVQQWTASTATHQQFSLVDQGGGYYQIVARHSGKCVDVDNASTTAGANVQQWSCNVTATNQQFRFTAVSAARMGRDAASLVAYPNPSGNIFRINIAGPFSYEIRNQMGQLLEKGEGNEETSVGSKLVPGLYLLQLQTSQGLREIKLIKH